MNNILKQLLEICDKKELKILTYIEHSSLSDCPNAKVEDKSGRVFMIYYEDNMWL